MQKKKYVILCTNVNNMDKEEIVRKQLIEIKNKIEKYHDNRLWDRYKKGTNEYELIFTSCYNYPSIALKKPISRSYFKHWELMHDFGLFMKNKNEITASFIAEGPGGFIEAFVDYTGKNNIATKQLYGITLLSNDKNVPQWKLPKQYRKKLSFLNGADNTGSLYNPENISDFIKTIGENGCDYVTCDGGFDFSNDFNNQEEASLKLIKCECYLGMRILKLGGIFVIKLFDFNHKDTRAILYMLYKSFKKVYFYKPNTSRPANSEKYIVCCHYFGNDIEYLDNLLLSNQIDEKIDAESGFNEALTEYNILYMENQTMNIASTLDYIKKQKNPDENIYQQYKCSIDWCKKYGLETSLSSIKFYNNI